ncbi:hypothetical protein Ciccas_005594 [Cichlidogyrus casuarinus]|uniref:Uncharacterized protein n=1 Tax=Cichlidogyrus casuarinus TaxID=1844966 RepID=A0ABD2Q8N2_9PLAT
MKSIREQLERKLKGDYLLEIFGFVKDVTKVNDSEFRFRMAQVDKCYQVSENHSVECVFYDTDSVNPTIEVSCIVRCVGKWNKDRKLFHCYIVNQMNEEDISVQEALQIVTLDELTPLFYSRHG